MNAPAPAHKAPPISFCVLPLGQLVEWDMNPRKQFDDATIGELADSFKAHGIVEPLIVRQAPGSPEALRRFEVIAGARRHRAAKRAGVEDVPVIIRELTDAQALAIAIIENAQREDVHPLDEAKGFAQLMDKKLMGAEALTAEQIAEKIGKSKEHVWARLKLLDASKPVQEALQKGRLKTEQAVLLARLPEADQKEGLAKCTDSWHPYNVAELRHWAKERDDAAKTRARIAKEIENAERNGHKVVKVLEYDMGAPPAGCLPASKYIAAGKSKCDHLALGFFVHGHKTDYTGRNLKVCTAPDTCPVHKAKFTEEERNARHISSTGRSLNEERKRKVRKQAADLVIAEILRKTDVLRDEQLDIITDALLNRLWHDHAKAICRRRGWAVSDISSEASKLSRLERNRFLLELALQVHTGWSGEVANLAKIAKGYRVDAQKIERELLDAIKEKAKAKKAKLQTSTVKTAKKSTASKARVRKPKGKK